MVVFPPEEERAEQEVPEELPPHTGTPLREEGLMPDPAHLAWLLAPREGKYHEQ